MSLSDVRRILWDKKNRLRAVYDNGALYHYIYDAAGERVKGQSTGQTLSVNREIKGGPLSGLFRQIKGC